MLVHIVTLNTQEVLKGLSSSWSQNEDLDQTTSSCIRILYAATVAACFFFVRVASPCLYSLISLRLSFGRVN